MPLSAFCYPSVRASMCVCVCVFALAGLACLKEKGQSVGTCKPSPLIGICGET